MAFDKLIDSAKFDAAMTASADAIRAKTGGTAKIPWDETTGLASAIEGITFKTQSKSVTPKASSQTIKPDSGYNGLSQVIVNGDSDLIAANIAKGVNIFGVTGTLESGGKIAEGSFMPAQYSNTSIYSHPVTISGLGFKPTRVIFYVTSAVSNCDGVTMYDSGTNIAVGRWNEEYYDEYDDEYYDDIYCGAFHKSPKVTFTSDGFKVSATELGDYNELQWFPCTYRYVALS